MSISAWAKAGMVAAGLLAGGMALAPTPAAAQRAGVYDVEGVNGDGSAYSGQLMLQQVGLASWKVVWQIGQAQMEGYGMSAGPVFSVGFTVGDRPGIGIYQVLADGSMTGQWTMVGSSSIGTENLRPR